MSEKLWDPNQEIADLKSELNEYHQHVWEYVQEGNVSHLFAGHHVAKALVMDHKRLKTEVERLNEQLSDCNALHEGAKAQWIELRREREITAILREALEHYRLSDQFNEFRTNKAREALAREKEMRKEKNEL